MKLWLLEARDDLPKDDNPWAGHYDCAFGVVVRAESEERARLMAQEESGDEAGLRPNKRPVWLEPMYVRCSELLPAGPAGVVLRDFNAG